MRMKDGKICATIGQDIRTYVEEDVEIDLDVFVARLSDDDAKILMQALAKKTTEPVVGLEPLYEQLYVAIGTKNASRIEEISRHILYQTTGRIV